MPNVYAGTLGSQYSIIPQSFGSSCLPTQDFRSANSALLYETFLYFYLESLHSSWKNAKGNAIETQKEDVLATGELLTQAKQVLGTSISDLSEMLGISRPTIYSYLSGNEPSVRSEVLMKRLLLLQKTIETIGNLCLSPPCPTILKRRDGRGKTFKELLANDEISDERILAFCNVELQEREKSKQRIAAAPASGSHKKNFNNEAFSVPVHLQ